MKCIGRTKTSNFLCRCDRSTIFLFCWQHVWQPFILISALVVFGAGLAEFSGYSLRDIFENTSHTGVSSPLKQVQPPVLQPDMACILDEHPTNEQFLIFTIKNEGLAPAKFVSVDHLTMRYHWKEQKIKVIIRGGLTDKFEYNEPGRKWLFIPQLDPNDHKSKVTGESVDRDESRCVNILYFYVTFRTPEMASREKTAIFFVEGKRIYTRTDYKVYKAHKQFTLIDLEIKRTLAEVPNLPTFGKHKRQ
jgi:hypothetical protein